MNFGDISAMVEKLIEKHKNYDIQEGTITSAKDGIAWVRISGAAKSQMATYPSIMTPSPNDDCLLIRSSKKSQQWRMISWFGKPNNGTQVATGDWRKNIQLAPPSNLSALGLQGHVIFSWSVPPQERVAFEIETSEDADHIPSTIQPLIAGGSHYIYPKSSGAVYARVRSINTSFQRSSWTDWVTATATASYALIVRESDGTPTVYNSNEIVFMGGTTVVDAGSGVVEVTPPTSAPAEITYKEVDGTPTVNNVATVRVPNGSLTDDTGGQVTLSLAPTWQVSDIDGTPTINPVKQLRFPNGSVTDQTNGVVDVAFPAATELTIQGNGATPTDIVDTIEFTDHTVEFSGDTGFVRNRITRERMELDDSITAYDDERVVYHDFVIISGTLTLLDDSVLYITD